MLRTEIVFFILFNSIYFIHRVVYTYYSTRHIGPHSIWMMWRNYHDCTARVSGRVLERMTPTFNTVNELVKIAQLHSIPVNCIY